MTRHDPFIGRQLASFRVERLLGRGGMGNVYYGWDVKLDRPVAIKVLDERFRDEPSYAERFISEARSIAALKNPNILQVYYANDEGGVFYFVMEYIRGLNLEQLLHQYTQAGELMPWEEVVRIGRAVANALDYAHQMGVIHRDVKPSNVIVSEEGKVVLADFGLAMNVGRGTMGKVFGSPQYISPEQARNSATAVPQSDLYSLAVMLFEMLTGALPFDDPSPTALAVQHMTLAPPSPRSINPELGPGVEAVLLKALRKTPQERFASGRALIESLEGALREQRGVPASTYAEPVSRNQATAAPVTQTRGISRVPVVEKVTHSLEGAAFSPAFAGPVPVTSPQVRPPVQSVSPAPKPQRWRAAPDRERRRRAWISIGCLAIVVITALFLVSQVIALYRGVRAPIFNFLKNTEPTPGLPGLPGGAPRVSPGLPVQPPVNNPGMEPTNLPLTGEQSTTADFVLYYNEDSFYFQNLTGSDLSIYSFAFERIAKKGITANRFDGWRWGEIYPKFRAGYCVEIKILGERNYLEPPECRNHHLVVRTPTRDAEFIFWTQQKGSSKEFRMLVDDEEVARCKTGAGTCEINLQ